MEEMLENVSINIIDDQHHILLNVDIFYMRMRCNFYFK